MHTLITTLVVGIVRQIQHWLWALYGSYSSYSGGVHTLITTLVVGIVRQIQHWLWALYGSYSSYSGGVHTLITTLVVGIVRQLQHWLWGLHGSYNIHSRDLCTTHVAGNCNTQHDRHHRRPQELLSARDDDDIRARDS